MKKVIGIYSQACNRQRPVIGRAGRLFYLLKESRAVHGFDAIDYAGEQSDHGDFTTVIDTVQGFLEYAALLESGVQPGASGEYDRAVAKGIREAVEEGDLLAIESPREVTDYNRYRIGDRVRIIPRRDAKYLYWHGHMGTIEEVGPHFTNGVPRTICMKFDFPSSGMSRMIIQPNEIEHVRG